MIAPSAMVRSTEAIGVAICMNRLGVSRFSSRMRMQSLCHFDRCRRVAMNAAHEQADLFDRNLADLHRQRQAAEVDDGDRVAKREQFIEVLRDVYDRRATRGEIDDRLMDGGGRARVPSPSRLADDERLRLLQDLAAHDELLQIAARQRAGERAWASRFHGISADYFGGIVGRLAGVDEAEAHHVHAVAPGQRAIVRERELADGRMAVALFRNRAKTQAAPLGDAEPADLPPGQSDRLWGWGRRFPTHRADQLVLPISGDAGDAEDLAGPHVERDIPERHAEFAWLWHCQALRR